MSELKPSYDYMTTTLKNVHHATETVTTGFVKIEHNCIYKQNMQDLIKYLEKQIDGIKCVYEYKENEYSKSGKLMIYQEILYKIKEGNYE